MRGCKWKKRERVGGIDIDRGLETEREKPKKERECDRERGG